MHLFHFGRDCTRSEPLSTLWFETWARTYGGFSWHLRLVTAESLFLPERKKKKNRRKHFVFAVACVHIPSLMELQQFVVLKGLWFPAGAEPQRLCVPPDLVVLLVESFCVWASAQKVLEGKIFLPALLCWVRRFERPCCNFMKISKCPFNLMLWFCVCSTIALCLAHDLTPPAAAAGDVRSLLSPTPRQLVNTREVFDAADFRELWGVGVWASGYRS